MCHLSDKYLSILPKITIRINIETSCHTIGCTVCIQGKQSAILFYRQKTRANCPLQLDHTDIWQGERYYISFMDNFIHFTIVYPIKHKSDALAMLKKYEALTTAHFSKSLTCLRCDNGGKYTSKTFLRFCEEKGNKYSI